MCLLYRATQWTQRHPRHDVNATSRIPASLCRSLTHKCAIRLSLAESPHKQRHIAARARRISHANTVKRGHHGKP